MADMQAQLWKGSNFTIGHAMGAEPGTVIFHFTGPLTARDMYTSLTPAALRNLFELPAQVQTTVHIFDLTGVPYMDSSGLGLLVSHYARCKDRGIKLVLAGVSLRVLQLMQLTKVDALIPMAATVEEANHGHPAN